MKKGQAQFIGWVLLIGFAVAIGALVGNWVMEQARETSESLIEMTTVDERCAYVSIAIKCENGVEVVNTGYFTIMELACYENGNYNVERPWGDIGLRPNEAKPLSCLCDSIVPIIDIDDKTIGCSEKQVEVECNE